MADITRGFYHDGATGRVYYITGGKRYWVPNEDALWAAASGLYTESPWEAVVYGREADWRGLPEGDWNAIKGGPFPVGGSAGASGGGSAGGGGGGGVTIPGVGSVSREAIYGLGAIALVVVLLLTLSRGRR